MTELTKDKDATEAKKQGWKDTPKCNFLVKSEDGKLYCAYEYMANHRKLLQTVDDKFLNDIGFYQSLGDALKSGEIVDECSVEKCPRFLGRLKNKI